MLRTLYQQRKLTFDEVVLNNSNADEALMLLGTVSSTVFITFSEYLPAAVVTSSSGEADANGPRPTKKAKWREVEANKRANEQVAAENEVLPAAVPAEVAEETGDQMTMS
jgi:hypothetical protein